MTEEQELSQWQREAVDTLGEFLSGPQLQHFVDKRRREMAGVTPNDTAAVD